MMLARVFPLFLIVVLLIACSSSSLPTSVTSAPVPGPVVPIGEPEIRDLGPTTETVWNCGSGGGTVVKHPAMSVATNYAVEWQVGGTGGVGVRIGDGVIPGGVDLSATLEGHYTTGLEQGIQQGTGWDLPAEPNTIVVYMLMWREKWQPGYVDVRLADQSVVRVAVRYRTGIQSEIVGKQRQSCGEESPPPVQQVTQQPSAPQQVVPPTMTASYSVSTYTFQVYANLSWQNTGIQIRSGDKLRIIWDGKSKWRGTNSGDFSDPLGGWIDNTNPQYACPPLMSPDIAGWNALVAKIGDNGVVTNPFKEIPQGEGELKFAMNDCDSQRFDNEGSVIVIIEVTR